MTQTIPGATTSREHDERYVGRADVTNWSTPAGKRAAGATDMTTRVYDGVVGSNGIESSP